MSEQTAYDIIHTEKDGIKIRLEFPKQPVRNENLHQEIKAILSCALREQMEKTVSGGTFPR